MKNYLTEKTIPTELKNIFPGYEFVHNRQVPNSNLKTRPDFRNDELKLIIEFDGYLHYSKSSVIIMDNVKDSEYSNMGYKIIRIPYFIQLSHSVVKYLFNKDINITQNYPHGFIDDAALLPCDFCELGINKFSNDLNNFEFIKNDILQSIKNKIIQHNHINKVLPPSLEYLI